jgi:hypothetical protein
MIDGIAYELLGLSPSGVDRLSFRDLWIMMAAAKRRDQAKWAHTLAVCQAILNWGGPRGQSHKPSPLGQMYEHAFGRAKHKVMTPAQIGAAFAEFATPAPKKSK